MSRLRPRRLRPFEIDATEEIAMTLHWPLEACGAFQRLRCWSWRHGRIPAEAAVRARILGLALELHDALWMVIAPAFTAVEGGFVLVALEQQRPTRRAAFSGETDDHADDRPMFSNDHADDRSNVQPNDRRLFDDVQRVDHKILDLSGDDHSGDQAADHDHQIRRSDDHLIDQRATRKPARATTAPVYSPAFLTFWEAYPRKIGKPAAWIEWTRKVPADGAAAVMAGLARWRASRRWQEVLRTDPELEGICHARTWLSQRRWEDPVGQAAPASTAGAAPGLPADLAELLTAAGLKQHDQRLFQGAVIERNDRHDHARLIINDHDLHGLVIRHHGPALITAARDRWGQVLVIDAAGVAA